MKLFSLLIMAVALLGVSCERHEFEGPDGTKQLHEKHGAPGAHSAHGDAAGSHEKASH